jgi:hypothetical protein
LWVFVSRENPTTAPLPGMFLTRAPRTVCGTMLPRPEKNPADPISLATAHMLALSVAVAVDKCGNAPRPQAFNPCETPRRARMNTEDSYRRSAERCRQLAARAKSEEERQLLLKLAESWDWLTHDRDRPAEHRDSKARNAEGEGRMLLSHNAKTKGLQR